MRKARPLRRQSSRFEFLDLRPPKNGGQDSLHRPDSRFCFNGEVPFDRSEAEQGDVPICHLVDCLPNSPVPGAGGSGHTADTISLPDQAGRHCPDDQVVWLDFRTRRYYLAGQKLYGLGDNGSYVCRKEAVASGFRRSLLGIR